MKGSSDFKSHGSWRNGHDFREFSFGSKNGCGGRSTGTSAVPHIADDFGEPRKSANVANTCCEQPQCWSDAISSPSLGNIRLIRVRGEQLSKSVTSCAQLRVRRQPESQADRVGRMPRRDGESI